MKKNLKIIYLVLLFISFSSTAFTQTLEENKIDDFTGNSVKRTSWEILNMSLKFTGYFRISQINETKYLDLKLMIGGKVFAIDEGDELMLKLSNDEIVRLPNLKYEITCTGCGAKGFSGSAAQGVNVSYILDNDQLEKLKSYEVVKIRVYTTDGYVEDDSKQKNTDQIKTALKLIE